MKIGLEIHVQLPTKSKMFCSCPTEGEDIPNSRVCPTCLGMPGSKPSLNKKALELGLSLAKMLGCSIPEQTWFSRKTYFYPDLCKHFQITQYDTPIGEKGVFRLGDKDIRITRVHLEEDPGKTKRVGDGTALVDYNRSGIPLVEIVTEPDISTPAEARQFLSELLTSIRHTIDLPADGDRSVRCDCNISVGKERCEVKNVTGLKNVENCLKYEVVRQTKILKAGGKIERETRRYDEERKVTLPARKKEFEADYGYIGEPDLGIYNIAEIAKGIKLKETPIAMAGRIQSQYGIDAKMAKQLVSTSTELAALFEEIVASADVKTAVKWCSGPISANWKQYEPSMKDELVCIVSDFFKGGITDTECGIKIKSLMTGVDAEATAKASEDIEALISKLLDENPNVIEDYRKNEKAANRIIGLVMKETGGAYSSADIVASTKKVIESRL
ncbi:MAG: Asp-tRNA(Asn)/Glu-tRNA(Gln) amidotransferase subunit GatB [Candidatus Methanomethylophilaceae archaeon]|nr:Asp-tRNA(Asn)/Glu-tRNA(Gln) amidotransferase subunit GatB [Candidatus Methanomethylophilaceae archaeon]